MHHAKQYPDRLELLSKFVPVGNDSGYGCSEDLFNEVQEFLQPDEILALLEGSTGAPGRPVTVAPVYRRSLAKAYGDPERYEAIVRNPDGSILAAEYLPLARLYLARGNHAKALSYLEQGARQPYGSQREQDELKYACYRHLGRTDEAEALLDRWLTSAHTRHGLEAIISVAGESRRAEISERFRQGLLGQETPSLPTISGLLELGETSQAAAGMRVVNASPDRFNYYLLADVAKQFVAAKYPLEGALCYRLLIEDTLDAARSKAYKHAVKYMKVLVKLDGKVEDYGKHPTHEGFVAGLREDTRGSGRFGGWWGSRR